MRSARIFVILLLLLIVTFAGCRTNQVKDAGTPLAGKPGSTAQTEKKPPNTAPSLNAEKANGNLKVQFLDVGQGDSILIQFPDGKNMLVDAGPPESEQYVVSYLEKQGIKKINYLVATHPHLDHIGGFEKVLENFDIGSIYMPKVTANTKAFENALLSIEKKGLKIKVAKAGVSVIDQDKLQVGFVGPVDTGYEDLNNYSAVTRIQYGETAFLLTGDTGTLSENQMIASGANLKADVLKVGHHGSSHSSSIRFLAAVSPQYAVISVGVGNDYGHPSEKTIAKLNKAGIKILRTDQLRTIVFSSDGRTASRLVS
jgi:beta-lactamase superfamily II metal-dependent hydrolase